MFFLFLFRRFGILVPVIFFVTSFLLETLLDHKYGAGFYFSHVWAIGLDFLLVGILLSVAVCWVSPLPTRHSYYSHVGGDEESALSTIKGYIETTAEMSNDRFQDLFLEPSEEDTFCYVPMNWCAMGLVGLGLLFMAYDGVQQLF